MSATISQCPLLHASILPQHYHSLQLRSMDGSDSWEHQVLCSTIVQSFVDGDSAQIMKIGTVTQKRRYSVLGNQFPIHALPSYTCINNVFPLLRSKTRSAFFTRNLIWFRQVTKFKICWPIKRCKEILHLTRTTVHPTKHCNNIRNINFVAPFKEQCL